MQCNDALQGSRERRDGDFDMKHFCVAIAIAVATAALPHSAAALEGPGPPFGKRFVDVVLVRPMTMVGSIASTVLCVGLSPLTWMTGVGDESVEYLVEAPWRFTAYRDPGDYRRYKDGRNVTGRVMVR
jgi:hypothetical protein